MILRSVGKTLKKPKRIKNFKSKVFKELEKLTDLMNIGKLKEKNILESIKSLNRRFHISFGQAQKPINVILKYHFYMTNNKNDKIKKVLHCPLDSIIIKDGLGMKKIPLTKINKKKYMELQHEIQNRCSFKVEFDTRWDEQNLRDAGIL
jgi:hypothetical protein